MPSVTTPVTVAAGRNGPTSGPCTQRHSRTHVSSARNHARPRAESAAAAITDRRETERGRGSRAGRGRRQEPEAGAGGASGARAGGRARTDAARRRGPRAARGQRQQREASADIDASTWPSVATASGIDGVAKPSRSLPSAGPCSNAASSQITTALRPTSDSPRRLSATRPPARASAAAQRRMRSGSDNCPLHAWVPSNQRWNPPRRAPRPSTDRRNIVRYLSNNHAPGPIRVRYPHAGRRSGRRHGGQAALAVGT